MVHCLYAESVEHVIPSMKYDPVVPDLKVISEAWWPSTVRLVCWSTVSSFVRNKKRLILGTIQNIVRLK